MYAEGTCWEGERGSVDFDGKVAMRVGFSKCGGMLAVLVMLGE